MDASNQEPLFKAMSSPDFYPHPVRSVTQKETHISKVFLTGEVVYKIKKAVDLGFLDFSTLSKRRQCCEQEVSLNRRLAEGVYLGVVPITRSGGRFRLSGSGEAIEYAVQMRQLPDHRSLAARIQQARVSVEQIEALAHRLTDFFQRQGRTSSEMAAASRDHVRSACEENFRQTYSVIGDVLNPDQYRAVRSATRFFLANQKKLFDARSESGKIYDGHGDLRTGHIYFDTPGTYQIIDCIEFNSRLRHIDIASDLAFLAMDLDVRGACPLGDALLNVYAHRTRDWQVYALIPFYKCYRAMVRCKVNCIRLKENTISKNVSVQARDRAAMYLAMADKYAQQFARPTLWVLCGQPGAGKSTLARTLSDTLLIDALRSDVIRKQHLRQHPKFQAGTEFEQGLYSSEAHRLTYAKMLRMARAVLEQNQSVIVDATFNNPDHRRMAIALAGQLDCRILFVECTAPADLIKSRLAHREGKASVSDARLRHYELLNRRYIPADEIEPTRRVRVDTTQTIHDCIQALLSRHCAGALGEPVTSNKQRSRPFRKEDSMFKTILAATDHITTNDPSVEAAALLAAENNSRLVILHVLESASTKNRRWVKHFETGKNIHCDTAYETLVTLQLEITHEKAMRHAQTAKIRVATGYPWEEILRQARSAGADLIVMGPHSGRAIQKGVVRVAGRVGSTVQGVITREKCPVMIVNPRLARQIYRFSRILVGIDFSAACECALCFTGQLAKFYDAKVFAFHMIPVPPYPKYTSTDYAADRTAAGERLKYFCREYLAKTDWTYHIHPGALPHQELLGCAEKVEADLIVLGSHTRQSQGKWYPGSAVERVSYRSNCPVMVINDPEALQPWQEMRDAVSGQSRSTNHRIHLYSGSSKVTP